MDDPLRAASEVPVDALSDDRVLKLCDLQMDTAQHEELSDLLGRNGEGQLDAADDERLEQLMDVYRYGMVLKSHALSVAVEPGLRPPLD